MLNSDSPIPLYHQLAGILQDRIRSGKYAPGDRIPSENQMARTFSIGRPTVRQAVDVLVRRGILIRKRGAGTFVQPKNKEVDLFSLAGTMSSFHRRGISLTTEILKPIRQIMVAEDSENPFSGENAFFFSRLSMVEQAPVLIEDLYLNSELFAKIDGIDMAGKSLSDIVFEKYFMRPKGGKQNFRIGYLNGNRAKALSVTPKTPILVVKRFLHFPQADNAIYSELFCRTDRFVFSQNIGGLTNG